MAPKLFFRLFVCDNYQEKGLQRNDWNYADTLDSYIQCQRRHRLVVMIRECRIDLRQLAQKHHFLPLRLNKTNHHTLSNVLGFGYRLVIEHKLDNTKRLLLTIPICVEAGLSSLYCWELPRQRVSGVVVVELAFICLCLFSWREILQYLQKFPQRQCCMSYRCYLLPRCCIQLPNYPFLYQRW